MNATSTNCIFPVINFEEVKNKVLNWTTRFSTFCFLDNHQYQIPPHSVECILAAGVEHSMQLNAGNALDQLQEFIDREEKWLFGHLSYDLKNEMEELHSAHPDQIQFPDLFFFQPQVLIWLSEKEMKIEALHSSAEEIFQQIMGMGRAEKESGERVQVQQRIPREEYLTIIEKLRRHILRGDCYEINFCQEFFAENAFIDPAEVYKKLAAVSPNPFSALYKLDNKYLLCASPERFLKKTGNKILSQPIKGTSKRGENKIKDEENRTELQYSAKDRSENIMVVDLVRNDLSKICEEGSVKVDELYGIYSFPQVHQMISTVSGDLNKEIRFKEIIRATFPMGSMTGAPKKKVMELIEQYEKTKRGIFSGAVGYITPGGDFDFNVVIRSIMYNQSNQYLSFQAGSGITFYSEPEKEWEECLLKAEAIRKVIS